MYKMSVSQKQRLLGVRNPEKGRLSSLLIFYSYIPEQCNLECLEEVWNKIVEEYDCFRLRIKNIKKGIQEIAPYEKEDIKHVKVNGKDEFNDLLKEEKNKAIGLYEKLYRVTLVDCGNGAGGIIVSLDHICFDGYSMGLIFKKMESYYWMLLNGESIPESKKYSYIDYVNYEDKYFNSKEYIKDCKWWKEKYKTLKNYSVPTGRHTNNKKADSISVSFYGKDYDQLLDFCKENTVNINSLIMSVISIVIYKISGEKCFGIHNLSHNRRTFAMKQTAGLMTQAMPVFYNVNEEDTFIDAIKKDYYNYIETIQHGRIKYIKHFQYNILRSIKLGCIFNHCWFQFSPMEAGKISENSSIGISAATTNECGSALYCGVYDNAEMRSLKVGLDYQIEKFRKEEIIKIKDCFVNIMQQGLANPNIQIKKM